METATWVAGGSGVIGMEGQPLFIERIIYPEDVTFVLRWRRANSTLREAKFTDLPSAMARAVKWANERNMFGDPE